MRFLFFFLLLSTGLTAQNDTITEFPIIAYWAKGDVYTYKVSKIENRWKNDSLIKADTIRYNATFTVIDSSATSYDIRWQLFDYYKSGQLDDQVAAKLAGNPLLLQDLSVEYRTDELGSFDSITNMEEILTTLRLGIGELLNEDSDFWKDLAGADRDKFRAFMSQILNPAYVKGKVFGELSALHQLHGATISRADTIQYQDEFVNPITQEPIGLDVVLFVDTVYSDAPYASFKQFMSINQEDWRDNTISYLKNIMGITKMDEATQKQKMTALTEELSKMKFESFYDNDYVINYYWGIVDYIDLYQELEVGEGENLNYSRYQMTIERTD